MKSKLNLPVFHRVVYDAIEVQIIFCCSLEGLRSMKAVRTQLGATLSIPARSSSELFDLMARYSSCLLILDRCEDAIRQRRTPFLWFLTQLLKQSQVKVIISSQHPMEDFEAIQREGIGWAVVTLGGMRPRDAALLLLESCERDLRPTELGISDDEEANGLSLLDALVAHPLLSSISCMPAAVRWAAKRLGDMTVAALLEELEELTPTDLRRTVLRDAHATPELTPRNLPAHVALANRPPALAHQNTAVLKVSSAVAAAAAAGSAAANPNSSSSPRARDDRGYRRAGSGSASSVGSGLARSSAAVGGSGGFGGGGGGGIGGHLSPIASSSGGHTPSMHGACSPQQQQHSGSGSPNVDDGSAAAQLRAARQAAQALQGKLAGVEAERELHALMAALQGLGGLGGDNAAEGSAAQFPRAASEPSLGGGGRAASHPHALSQHRRSGSSGGKQWQKERSSSGRKLSWDSRQMQEMAMLSEAQAGWPVDEDGAESFDLHQWDQPM